MGSQKGAKVGWGKGGSGQRWARAKMGQGKGGLGQRWDGQRWEGQRWEEQRCAAPKKCSNKDHQR